MSETQTVNTDVQSPEPVIKTGSSSDISFDEMEVLEHVTDKQIKKEKESKKEKGESENENQEKSKEDEEVKKSKEQGLTEKPKAKLYKLTHGDSTYELSADVPVPVKISGKDEMVPLQELINNFSGKTDYSRKYTQLDQERKKFISERDGLKTTVDQFFKTVQSGDTRGAFTLISEAAGLNPDKEWEKITTQIESKAAEYSKLTPEERAARRRDEELEYYKKKSEIGQNLQVQQKEIESTRQKVSSLCEQNGIAFEEFKTAYDYLKEEADKGVISMDDLTPELVVNYHKELNTLNQLSPILAEVFPELEEKDRSTRLMEARKIWSENPKFSASDIKDILSDAYSQEPKKSALAKKVEKKKQTEVRKPQQEGDPFSWDDL